MHTWVVVTLCSATPVTAEAGKGLVVTSADGDFAIGVRARFQLRQSAWTTSEAPEEVDLQTQLYTTRLWVAGHLFDPTTTYVLQLAVGPRDFRDGAISPVYDAYLDLARHRDVSVRLGQFFVPFDRLRTIREFALQLPDRPRVVSELTLDRDLGVMVYSESLGGSALAYRVGLFGGSGIHTAEPHPAGGLAVARLELRPLGPVDDDREGDLTRRAAPGLALGLGAAYNLGTTRIRSTTSTVFPAGTADYLHLAADSVFKWRGLALEGELVARVADQDTVRGTLDDGTVAVTPTRSGWGFVAQPALMLSDRVELATRYGRLGAFAGTDPALIDEVAARGNEVAVGTNLYLRGHAFKVQTSVGAAFGADPGAVEWVAHTLLDMTF